jgi:hypothetical protein
VRMDLHTGEAAVHGTTYVGLDVHQRPRASARRRTAARSSCRVRLASSWPAGYRRAR